MLYGKSAAEARAASHVIAVNNRDYVLSGYVGAAPVRGFYLEGNEVNDNGLPQGFLVEQPAGAITLPHFHETNQFQVVVGGGGRFGKFPVPPLSVQYANAHTPYGPIVGDDEAGITYFTLRATWDPGAKYMPASRDRLVKGNQRSRLVAGLPADAAPVRRARTAPESETVIVPEADGLAAWRLRLGAGQSLDAPPPAGSGGPYIVVTEGSLVNGGRELDRLSVLFVTADEPALAARAGDDGLDLLVLQFPG
ncbi:MAG: hypothetical protein VW405_10350 [Rhodospirillaceae bacterium]